MDSEEKLGCFGVGALAVALGAWFVVSFVGCHAQTSEGDRMGVVTKFSRKGVVWSTWEGEAILGSSDVPGVGTTWAFTVDDAGPVEDVKRAMELGKKVRMHYVEFLKGGKPRGDTDYRVVRIEPVGVAPVEETSK